MENKEDLNSDKVIVFMKGLTIEEVTEKFNILHIPMTGFNVHIIGEESRMSIEILKALRNEADRGIILVSPNLKEDVKSCITIDNISASEEFSKKLIETVPIVITERPRKSFEPPMSRQDRRKLERKSKKNK